MKLIILLLLSSFLSFAGNEVGNGGGVLLDKKSGMPRMFFDAWESEARYGYKVKWPSENKNDVKVALAFTARLKNVDPKLQKELEGWIATFHSESVFESDLPLIFDMGTGIHLPKDLKIAQLIIQRNLGPNDVQYLLNKKYWHNLPVIHRGVAILHEVIYRKAIQVNPRLFSSVKVRILVTMIISDEISRLRDHQNLLRTLEIQE